MLRNLQPASRELSCCGTDMAVPVANFSRPSALGSGALLRSSQQASLARCARSFASSPRSQLTPSPPASPTDFKTATVIPSTSQVAPPPPVVPTATTTLPIAPLSPPPPPPPKGKKQTPYVRNFARTVLVAVVGAGTFVVWHSHDQRNPGEQLPHDPTLPTVVVLGNGWGSTAFLKQLDNEGYNVVRTPPCPVPRQARMHP